MTRQGHVMTPLDWCSHNVRPARNSDTTTNLQLCHARREYTSLSCQTGVHVPVMPDGSTRPCHARREYTSLSCQTGVHVPVMPDGSTRPCHARREYTSLSCQTGVHVPVMPDGSTRPSGFLSDWILRMSGNDFVVSSQRQPLECC
ncbi:hypothetical protein BaRGS_00012036 [Batillaria attramentaria]|uniref:Uncharacterized protein n=1 Tax=Batillaria attramentaria TaxID=370345 RepID=A0ABD0LBT5_9CAEN